MQRSFRLTALAAVMVSAAALVATGQQAERQQERRQRQQGQAGQAAEFKLTEQHLAAWLIIDNQGEVALAEFAQEQSQNEEVKQLAQTLVQDHTEYISKLQQFAGPIGASLTTRRQVRGQSEEGSDNPAQRREQEEAVEEQNEEQEADQPRAEGQEEQPGRQAGENQAQGRRQSRQAGAARQGEGVDLIAFKQEIGQKCLESTKEALGEKQGADFDKAFLAQQCFAHQQMIDALEVTAQHASGEFKEVLMTGQQTAQQHLEHCQTLCKQLEGASGTARTADREETRPE